MFLNLLYDFVYYYCYYGFLIQLHQSSEFLFVNVIKLYNRQIGRKNLYKTYITPQYLNKILVEIKKYIMIAHL